MYSEWVSLRHSLHSNKGNKSVLNHFPTLVGRDVAHSVVQTLIHEQGMPQQKVLSTPSEVDWAMEVFCYGLTLPMTEADGEIIKGCVNVYTEWLSVLLKSNPGKSIPDPLIHEPDKYSQRVFHHLRNLFKIRVDDGSNLAMQASLCIRVLQFLKHLTSEGELEPDTWETLLCVLMSINEQLLSTPYSPGGLSQHLCDILINSLLEIWLNACVQYFPAPSMWKTLQELCMAWRHHNSMIEYWSSTSLSLTRKVIKYLYGSTFSLPPVDKKKNDVQVPVITNKDTLLQSWFRILHIIGNPVDLCNRELISDTPKFKEFALASEEVMNPSAHPCLDGLPQIFLHAMKGVSVLVNNFLGVTITQEQPVKHTPISAPIKSSSPSVAKKREHKSLSIGLALGLGDYRGIGMRSQTMPSRHSSGSSPMTNFESLKDNGVTATPKTPPASSLFSKSPVSSNLPSVDSLLDLFGAWLFEAAFAKTDMKSSYTALAEVYESFCITANTTGDSMTRRMSTGSTSSLSKREIMDEESFEPGRAEAYGALCRIFCSQPSGQEIRPVYLSRFYLSIATGLLYNENCTGHVLCSILLNSPDLLRVNLQGVQILLPHLLSALEIVLPKRQIQLRCTVSTTELRRSAIHLLLSMLCLPLHFQSLPIQDMTGYYQNKTCEEGSTIPSPLTFLSLKPRMTRLLLEALQFESDSFNVQILLGGILLLIQDCETADSLGISHPCHGGSVGSSSTETDLVDAATKGRVRCSTGGSSLISEGSFSQLEAETEAKLTFAKVSTQSYDPSTVCGLFVQLTHILCNKLVVTRSSKWKPDVHVTLAAFEVLSGLAQLSTQHLDKTECKSTIHWLCDYVTYQANKPATHHSRDLHSMIVAAFHCIKTWIMSHAWLMDAEDCLQAVMEVVELGISGSKSKGPQADPGSDNEEPMLKGDKELKPVSFRVRAAAEGLLTCIMEHVGAFPPPCGPVALSSLLDEEALLAYSRANKGLVHSERRFRYFVLRDNQLILGLLEDSLEPKDVLPTVSAIVRSPSGRHVWTMQLRHFSRNKHDLVAAHLENPGRPSPLAHPPQARMNTKHRNFPVSAEAVPLAQADRSIPELDNILDEKLCEVQDHMRTLMQKQAEHESVVQAKAEKEMSELKYPSADTESKPPRPVENFYASRLLLSHLGLLTLDALEGNPNNSFDDASLVALDSSRAGFQAALRDLDRLPTRVQDTVFVFYVKADQNEADAILENELNTCKHGKVFVEFLLSLGWPVDIETHPGWTGNVERAWVRTSTRERSHLVGRGGAGLGASSMSTITSSTSTMGHDEYTPSSDDEGIFVRDRLMARISSEDDVTATRAASITAVSHPELARPQSLDENVAIVEPESVDKEVNQILYYADIRSEVAFVAPALLPQYQRFRRMIVKAETSEEETEEADEPPTGHRRARSGSMGSLEIKSSSTSSMELRQPLARQSSDGFAAFEGRTGRFSDISESKPTKVSPHNTSAEVNVIVTWLEQFSDHACLPVDDLLMEMDFGTSSTGLVEKDTVVIFLNSLKSGLYRVHIRSTIRSPVGGPLVDGMVVSRRALGSMVRQTAINIFHRRRLEIDTYSPPKVCRKLKIQDIVKKYRREMSIPEFYVSLFNQGD
ncbi:ral GTPase-activating protein subunit beta [Nematostella vectensis]|uniref:ral GTPase-activating protein subunit beta n=1 Tax=Nematostella vectensis TaxID=45351 RepID=UPI0020778472|nr:ral GTPase-activating protein subunit beta [Nematostella vectensis]